MLAAAVGIVYHCPALLRLYSEFGADYKKFTELSQLDLVLTWKRVSIHKIATEQIGRETKPNIEYLFPKQPPFYDHYTGVLNSVIYSVSVRNYSTKLDQKLCGGGGQPEGSGRGCMRRRGNPVSVSVLCGTT